MHKNIFPLFVFILVSILPMGYIAHGFTYGEEVIVTIHGKAFTDDFSDPQIMDLFHEGVEIYVWVEYRSIEMMGEVEVLMDLTQDAVVESGRDGSYYKAFNLGDKVESIILLGAKLNNPSDWIIESEIVLKIMDTELEKYFSIIKIDDNDKNGIHDPYEWDLVKKFCPSFIFNLPTEFCYPEPAQIIGGKYNSEIYAEWSGALNQIWTKGMIAELVDIEVETDQFIPVIPYEGEFDLKFGSRFNYSNKIRTNPLVVSPNKSIRVWNTERSQIVGQGFADHETLIWFYFDWPGDNWREWANHYKPFREDKSYRSTRNIKYTVYSTIWKEESEIVIQYWFFYPYNHWANNHEGDWEHINVILTSQFPNETQIKSVVYFFHHYWHEFIPSEDNLFFYDESHVVVYVGGSLQKLGTGIFGGDAGHVSGASYPDIAIWEKVSSFAWETGWVNEIVYGRGPILRWDQITYLWDKPHDGWGIELLKDPNYYSNPDSPEKDFFSKHPEFSWLNVPMIFGSIHNDPHPLYKDLKEIRHPYFHDAWRKIRGSSTYDLY